MEILDKSKIEFIKKNALNTKERFVKIFREKPKESIGIYISDDYVYFVAIFFENGEWHILFVDNKKLSKYEYQEEAADWALEKIKETEFKNPVITLGTPDKILFKREVELKNVPNENIAETLYWDFVKNCFENNEEFNIAYYKLENNLYFAAGLEVENQKNTDKIFKERDIFISNWVTFSENIDWETDGQFIKIFDASVNAPIDLELDLDMILEYIPAIYAAMYGANLFYGEQKISFPPLYKTEILNWKKLSLTVFIMAMLFFSSIFFYDNYKIYSAAKELENTDMELKNLSITKKKIELYNEILKDTNEREEVVVEMTKNRLPIAGVLLHLGTITEDNVRLKSVKISGDKIELTGEAKNEDDLDRFLENISNQKDIFLKYPKSIKVDNKEYIYFSFSMNL